MVLCDQERPSSLSWAVKALACGTMPPLKSLRLKPSANKLT